MTSWQIPLKSCKKALQKGTAPKLKPERTHEGAATARLAKGQLTTAWLRLEVYGVLYTERLVEFCRGFVVVPGRG